MVCFENIQIITSADYLFWHSVVISFGLAAVTVDLIKVISFKED